MNRLLLLFALLLIVCSPASAQEKKRFILYATLLETAQVTLADGSRWQMDKGDTFPIVMFKEQQTRIVLQLAGTTFLIGAERAQVVEEKDLTEAQVASYRTNVNSYIQSRSDKWKEQAK